MKICYLILCHKNEEQVKNLIQQLSTDSTDFYIHVDKKASFLPSLLTSLPNVYVINHENSFEVSWEKMSMVYATLALINMMSKKRTI